MRVVMAIGLLASACGGSDAPTLADLQLKRLSVGVASRWWVNAGDSITLRYEPVHPELLADGCPDIDTADVHATLGGFRVPFHELGFWESGTSGESYCYMSFRHTPLIEPANGTVTLVDRSQEIVATFAQSSLEPRSASHPTWSFAIGETVTLRWSHPTDLLGADTFVTVDLASSVPTIPVAIAPPDAITFVVPSEHPAGPVSAFVAVESRPSYEDTAKMCINALSCSAGQGRSYTHDAMVY